MGEIIDIELDNNKISKKGNTSSDYGRALINSLIDEDKIVLCPAFLSGSQAPSTGRLIIGSKNNDGSILYSNIGGTIAQKLASLNIDALIISGKNQNTYPLTIFLEEDNIKLDYIKEVKELEISPTIEKLYSKYGDDCGIMGIGPSGENLLAISTLFTTYPRGNPEYYCARGYMGHVFGLKNIKALVVKNKSHFNARLADPDNFNKTAKQLSQLIIDHPICGRALPSLGSSTIMKLINEETINYEKINAREKQNLNDNINRTCSPLCVVGCLNRHVTNSEEIFSAPFDSEVDEAFEVGFGIHDRKFARNFTKKCFELGIDVMEFIFSCQMYFNLMEIKINKSSLDKAIENVRSMTLEGRVLGSTTKGIYNLFPDKDISKEMLTRPSIIEEDNYRLNIPSRRGKLEKFSDLQYLYSYIILLENLGFCLFSSFAFLDDEEALDLLGKLYYYKSGEKTTGIELLEYSYQLIKNEKKIPNFVKVLYRYFKE